MEQSTRRHQHLVSNARFQSIALGSLFVVTIVVGLATPYAVLVMWFGESLGPGARPYHWLALMPFAMLILVWALIIGGFRKSERKRVGRRP